jgi:hypothetical protein
MRQAIPDFPDRFWWRVFKAGCWLVIVSFGVLAVIGALHELGVLHFPSITD